MLKHLMLWMALAVAAFASGCATAPGAGQGEVVMEDAMVPSDAGISVYVRNKRPAGMSTFSPDKATMPYSASDIPAPTLLIKAE